jgi:uncharacterized repeat protein (TIGR03803 family)
MAPLALGSDGFLYGVGARGGIYNKGVIFRVNPVGLEYVTLRHFGSGQADGELPIGGVTEGSDGALYGTTYWGGTAGAGTIFRVSRDGNGYAVLLNFGGTNSPGRNPQGRLILGTDGFFYGTTANGGTNNSGTLFRLTRSGTSMLVLHHFGAGGDGRTPTDGVVEGPGAMLYGVTTRGGAGDGGTIYKINSDGRGYAVIHQFEPSISDGFRPWSGLAGSPGGATLFGTTRGGGMAGAGVIFRLELTNDSFALLHSFGQNKNEERFPEGGLMLGSGGFLVGTTREGNSGKAGTVFRLRQDGTGYEILHGFDASCREGTRPEVGVVETGGGLYGITSQGGNSGRGTLFRLQNTGTNYLDFYAFGAGGNDGRATYSRVIEGNDDLLYGTCSRGGNQDEGIIYKVRKDGSDYRILHHFDFGAGMEPFGSVIESADGMLYGTTRHGGASDCGTIFRLQKDGGGFMSLRSFTTNSGAGAYPLDGVIEGTDGKLYGRTVSGGNRDASAIFRVARDGAGYSLIHSFDFALPQDSMAPSPLIEARDGQIYGTTAGEGTSKTGSIFRLNKDGSGFQTLHEFANSASDGKQPQGGLVEASDGLLYGAASEGGQFANGVIYRIEKAGSNYSVIHHFSAAANEGAFPTSGLVEGPDGSLYGTTQLGSFFDLGSVFRLNRDGTQFKTIREFRDSSINGWFPYNGLAKLRDGTLAGTTLMGGAFGNGTVFRLHPTSLDVSLLGNALLLSVDSFPGEQYLV